MKKMVKKANAFIIVNHWVLAGSFFIQMISGFGLLFHIQQVISLFGDLSTMKSWHIHYGVVFLVSLIFTMFHYLSVSLGFSSDDIQWLSNAGGHLSKKVKLPPQDELNAGQKIYYLTVLITGLALCTSGLFIWLRPFSADMAGWLLLAHRIHRIGLYLLILIIPFHIYLATLANPGTLRIMVYGTIPLDWAKKRHAKWVQQMGF